MNVTAQARIRGAAGLGKVVLQLCPGFHRADNYFDDRVDLVLVAVTNTRGKILEGRGVADRPQPALARKGVAQSAHACQLRIGNERLGARVRRGSEHEGLTTRPARRYALC